MASSVYLDMDPGHDDALALLVALALMPVRGLTTVAGNQTGDKTYLNARRILFLANQLGLPVAPGYNKPLFRDLVTAAHVHGPSGLDGYQFPEIPSPNGTGHAMEFLENALSHEQEPVVWIATGPLTNVAALLIGHPHLHQKISQIAFMGGALVGGNITPCAEFNTYVDPDAAAYVVGCGIPTTMVGLDVTHKALLAGKDLERFRDLRPPIGEMLYRLFTFFANHEPNAGDMGMPIHDVLAIAAIANPTVFAWETIALHVERCDEQRRGATETKIIGSGYPEIRVAVDIDVSRFFDWFWQSLAYYQ